LPQVICPQCGARNDTRAPDYPFCVGCQDNLVKCGYCRWFSRETGVCTHPVVAGIFRVNASATPPCVYHTPAERVLASRRLLQGLIWVLVAIVIGALAYGLIRFRGPSPPPPAADLKLEVEASYEGAVADEPYRVTVIADNRSSFAARDVKLEISAGSLESFELLSVEPKPEGTESRGEWRILRLSELRPLERRPIVLEVRPRQPGNLHLVLRLVSDENLFHGQLDLPVVVEPPKKEGPSTEGGGREDETRRRDAQAEGAERVH
jgi:hypothetical protein